MVGLLLILDIAMIVVFFLMYAHITGMHKTLEQMDRTLKEMAKTMGCAESKSPAAEGDEDFMGYVVTAEVRRIVQEYLNDGVYTKAMAELRRATRMPRDVASAYLDHLSD